MMKPLAFVTYEKLSSSEVSPSWIEALKDNYEIFDTNDFLTYDKSKIQTLLELPVDTNKLLIPKEAIPEVVLDPFVVSNKEDLINQIVANLRMRIAPAIIQLQQMVLARSTLVVADADYSAQAIILQLASDYGIPSILLTDNISPSPWLVVSSTLTTSPDKLSSVLSLINS